MLKAIDTVYGGYRFRSRLEARWAVFFDALGVKWEYEREGYVLSDGSYYLPDFWLPDQNLWVEIKPKLPIARSWPDHKAWATTEGEPDNPELASRLAIMCGSPWPLDDNFYGQFAYEGFVYGDNNYLWCECPDCGLINIQYDGRAGRNCQCSDDDKRYNTHSPRLVKAYLAAKQARFEHGETPIR